MQYVIRHKASNFYTRESVYIYSSILKYMIAKLGDKAKDVASVRDDLVINLRIFDIIVNILIKN